MNPTPEFATSGSILEGVVTTLNDDRTVNVSPMGPIVDEQMQQFVLRPFRSSTTYKNLKRDGHAVFHVTDDVELIAQAAVGQPQPTPKLIATPSIDGMRLADACRWYALEVVSIEDQGPRTRVVARTLEQGRNRDFFGFNRAKHAVLEAAILATRVQLLPADQIAADLDRLAPLVEKTGGPPERRAFDFLRNYINRLAASTTGDSDNASETRESRR